MEDISRTNFHGIDKSSGANKVYSPKHRPEDATHRSKAKQSATALNLYLRDAHQARTTKAKVHARKKRPKKTKERKQKEGQGKEQ